MEMHTNLFFDLLAKVIPCKTVACHAIKRQFGRVAYNYIALTRAGINNADPDLFIILAAVSIIEGHSYETRPLLSYAVYLLTRKNEREAFINSVQMTEEYRDAIIKNAGCDIFVSDLKNAEQIDRYIMSNDKVYHAVVVDALSGLFEEKFNIKLVSNDGCFEDLFNNEAKDLHLVSESQKMPKDIQHLKIANLSKELAKRINDKKRLEQYQANGDMINFHQSANAPATEAQERSKRGRPSKDHKTFMPATEAVICIGVEYGLTGAKLKEKIKKLADGYSRGFCWLDNETERADGKPHKEKIAYGGDDIALSTIQKTEITKEVSKRIADKKAKKIMT